MKILLLCIVTFALASCAGLPPRTYSVFGETEDGIKFGGSVSLGDTRGLAK